MDPGTKVVVFIGGLGAVVTVVSVLWKQFIGVESSEPADDAPNSHDD